MDFDLSQVDALLSTTRAVRRRLDFERPVERGVLLECLELAIQAPTGGNRQGWRWLIVTDADRRRALAELYRRAGRPYIEQTLAGLAPGSPQHRVYSSAQYLVEHLDRVPVHVIPCLEGAPPRDNPALEASFWGSIYPALWSFQLALRSRGLGSVLTTLHLLHAEEAARLLEIPDGFTQAALLPVAHTREGNFRPARRAPVAEIAHWERWGGRDAGG